MRRIDEISSYFLLHVGWLSFLDEINAIQLIVLEIKVLSFTDLNWFKERRDCGDEVRRLILEERDLIELLRVHDVRELNAQLKRELVQ